jgi:hypothetical protein
MASSNDISGRVGADTRPYKKKNKIIGLSTAPHTHLRLEKKDIETSRVILAQVEVEVLVLGHGSHLHVQYGLFVGPGDI